uniref:Uncharacterized protein n=1 Tax=Arundo donax TaxID=35708 RepID=A0A0A8YV79_ARUDO
MPFHQSKLSFGINQKIVHCI